MASHCTTIKWLPPYWKHPTLECQISVHIARRMLKLFVKALIWHGFVWYFFWTSALCPSWRTKIKSHFGWFAQVKIGTKKSQKIKTKNVVKISCCCSKFLQSENGSSFRFQYCKFICNYIVWGTFLLTK